MFNQSVHARLPIKSSLGTLCSYSTGVGECCFPWCVGAKPPRQPANNASSACESCNSTWIWPRAHRMRCTRQTNWSLDDTLADLWLSPLTNLPGPIQKEENPPMVHPCTLPLLTPLSDCTFLLDELIMLSQKAPFSFGPARVTSRLCWQLLEPSSYPHDRA